MTAMQRLHPRLLSGILHLFLWLSNFGTWVCEHVDQARHAGPAVPVNRLAAIAMCFAGRDYWKGAVIRTVGYIT